MKNHPIGVFDSGIGGKLIAQQISKTIPNIKVIFKSDNQHFPYGNKSKQYILRRTALFTQKLIKQDCKLIVIACNSITTNIINQLRKKFLKIKFVGIEPPIKPLVKLTKTKKIAVIGSQATINSQRLKQLQKQYAQGIDLYCIPCPGLAVAIEANIKNKKSPDISKFLKKFLDQPISQGIDAVGIACTHYSYVLSQMKKLYPQVKFYDPAQAVVAQVQRQLSSP